MSDRVVIMSEGKIMGVLNQNELNLKKQVILNLRWEADYGRMDKEIFKRGQLEVGCTGCNHGGICVLRAHLYFA